MPLSSVFAFRASRGVLGAAFLAASLFLAAPAAAQWRVDATFDPGEGASELVFSVAGQSGGAVLAAGRFTAAGGAPRSGVVRFLADGGLEPGLAAMADGTATVIRPTADGHILLGGGFHHLDGQPYAGLARFTAAGALDPLFRPRISGTVFQVAEQPDGRLLAAGYFQQAGGQPCGSIIRLLPDGSLDPSFDAGLGADHYVLAMALDGQGRVLLGGYFGSIGGVPRARLARLFADGSLDPDFQPSADAPVAAIAVQPDGKILVGGEFITLNGQPAGRLGRLLEDGSLDPAFSAGAGADGPVHALALDSAGRALIGGAFTQVAGAARLNLARIGPDGALDSVFDLPADGTVKSVARLASGKILIGGDFLAVGGVRRVRVARLELAAGHDPLFDVRLIEPTDGYSYRVNTLVPLAGGRILIGGAFSAIPTRRNLALAERDGSLVAGFDPRPSAPVHTALELRDGRLLVGGEFFAIGGSTVRGPIARLLPDGRLDRGFSPPLNFQRVFALAEQPDGKLLVGGTFSDPVSGRRNLVRLLADGTIDSSFHAGTAGTTVQSLALQPDGRILVAGSFSSWNGEAQAWLARLEADGSLDLSFRPALDAPVWSVAADAGGRILVGGQYAHVNGEARQGLVRLEADGSLDAGFRLAVDPAATSWVPMANRLADGSYLAAGILHFAGGEGAQLARLRPDGALDRVLQPLNSPSVTAMAVEADGGALLTNVSRLYPDQQGRRAVRYRPGAEAARAIEVTADGTRVAWRLDGAAPAIEWARFALSTDGGATYTDLGAGEPEAGGWSLDGLALPYGFPLRLRVTGPAAAGTRGASRAHYSQTRELVLR